MRRTDNRWTKRVTEWQPRNSKRSQGRQRIRWRDEIVAFAGVRWSSLTSDREEGGRGWERPLSCSGLAMADDDDDT